MHHHEKKYWLDWKIWAGAALCAASFFILFWAFSIGCVVMGGSPEVCGL